MEALLCFRCMEALLFLISMEALLRLFQKHEGFVFLCMFFHFWQVDGDDDYMTGEWLLSRCEAAGNHVLLWVSLCHRQLPGFSHLLPSMSCHHPWGKCNSLLGIFLCALLPFFDFSDKTKPFMHMWLPFFRNVSSEFRSLKQIIGHEESKNRPCQKNKGCLSHLKWENMFCFLFIIFFKTNFAKRCNLLHLN